MLRLAALLLLLVSACHAPGSRMHDVPLNQPDGSVPTELAQPEEPGIDSIEPDEPGIDSRNHDEANTEGTHNGGRLADPPRDRKEKFELDPDFDIFADEEGESQLGEPFTDAALQARVAEIAPRVAEMRGMEWKHAVPAGLQSADEFIEFAIDDFEQEYGMETFRAMAEAYRLLGLIDPEMDLFETTMDLLRGQVGGYYDPRTKRFYMIDSYRQGATADIILAHELTHALDDQHFNLQALMESADSADKEFAIRAVVEGSGTSLMNLYALRGALSGWLELDPAAMMAEMEGQSESLEAAPAYLVMTLALPYMEGNKLLTRKTNVLEASMTEPSDTDLRAAFANPPRSSEQVLHFEKYWDPAQVDEPIEVDISGVLPQLGEGWQLSHADTLGELGCYVMTAETLPDLTTAAGQLAGRWTNAAATGWGGDRYASCTGPGGARLMVWDSVWDSESDAMEFAVALKRDPAPRNAFLRTVKLSGTQVRAIFANEAGAAAGLAIAEVQ